VLLTLIGKESLYKLNLPQVADGNYWISKNVEETEEKLLNIQGKNGQWEVISNNQMRIISNKNITITNEELSLMQSKDMVLDKIVLEEYHMYFLCYGNQHKIYLLYCSPSYEKNIRRLKINSEVEKILIGSSRTNRHFLS